MIPLKDNIPTERFPVITVLLIAVNVAVFLFLQHPTGFSTVDDRTVVRYGAIPYELTHPGKHCALGDVPTDTGEVRQGVVCEGQRGVQGTAPAQPATWLTVLTSMFLHGGFLHLIGNMLFLWIFGNNVEDAMGRPRFVAFYLLGGVAATALQVAIGPDSTAPGIGASGAIAGVLGGYILLYPSARVLTLVFIIFLVTLIEIPAVLMLGLWFLQQLYFGTQDLSNPVGGGVAYFAHIGGFAFGLVFIRAFAKRLRRAPGAGLAA